MVELSKQISPFAADLFDTGNVAGSGGSWALTLVGTVGIGSGNANVIPLLPNVQMIALTTTTQTSGLPTAEFGLPTLKFGFHFYISDTINNLANTCGFKLWSTNSNTINDGASSYTLTGNGSSVHFYSLTGGSSGNIFSIV